MFRTEPGCGSHLAFANGFCNYYRDYASSPCCCISTDSVPGLATDLNYWRKARMKTIVKMLGVVAAMALVTACGPDMKTINNATERAQADATKAEASANAAEASANQAAAAAQQADTAASGAEDAVRRANDAVSRLEAAFSTSVTK